MEIKSTLMVFYKYDVFTRDGSSKYENDVIIYSPPCIRFFYRTQN